MQHPDARLRRTGVAATFAALLVVVPLVAAGCPVPPKPPDPPEPHHEWCSRSYEAAPKGTDVRAGTVTVLVTVNQYRWYGQPNDPKGGTFRAETRDAPADGVSFEVTFRPSEPNSGLAAASLYAVSSAGGLLTVKVPAGVLEYARYGSGAVVGIEPDLRAVEPGLLVDPEIDFPAGPIALEFQTLSDMLLSSGR